MSSFIDNRLDYLTQLTRNQSAYGRNELTEAVNNLAAEILYHLRNQDNDMLPGAIIHNQVVNPEPVAPLSARTGSPVTQWRAIDAEELGIASHLRPRSDPMAEYLIRRVEGEATKQGKEVQVTRKAA